MAKQTINIGASANDGSGDPLRNAFDKVNDNFNEIYFSYGNATNLTNIFDSNGNLDLSGEPHKVSFLYDTKVLLDAVDPGTYHGAIGHAHDTGSLYYAHGSWRRLLADTSGGTITNYTDPLAPHVYANNVTNAETSDYVLKTNANGTYTWVEQATGGGGGGNVNEAFKTISVAGQSDIVADGAEDSITFVAGSNVTITTDANNDEITINASGGGGGGGTDLNSLSAGAIDVAADSFGFIDANDSNASKKESIVDFVAAIAGTNLSASNGVLSASGGGGGSSTLAGLTEVNTADLDLHDMAATAVSTYYVVGPDSSKYTMDQLPGDNPTVYVQAGQTIGFELNGATSSHPFEIRQPDGTTAYNTGLVHYGNDGTKSTGSNAQGKTEGTLYWKVPGNINGTYHYICTSHSSMIGDIVISDPSASGGGGSLSRVTETQTTSSFANLDYLEFTNCGKSFAIYEIVAEKECRIRIYSDTASRAADLNRSAADDPPEGAGVIAEFVATSPNTTFKVTPAIYGWLDNSETEIPMTITNNTGSSTDMDVTITVLKLES